MPKIKVKLSEATSSKDKVKGALINIATKISYSNSTAGVHAQREMVSSSESYKTTRARMKTALTRDTGRIEELAVEFLEIDEAASKKSSANVGKHSKT